MKVRELRRLLTDYLCDVEYETADALIIITDTLKIDKTALLIGEREVSPDEEKAVFERAKRLKNGEPVQYIVGRCEFMSLPFYVEDGVLIPRSDTEILIETLLERLSKDKPLSLIDMCCGSGCIGISLAHYMKNINLSMCDVSDVAIRIAGKNGENLIKDREYKIFKMNLLEDFPYEEYDCIVSNPPYIKTEVIDSLEKKVKGFEPHLALDGGVDGLKFYNRIAKEAKLKKGGILAFEIGFDQGINVAEILNEQGYEKVEVIKDLEGRDRVVLGYQS